MREKKDKVPVIRLCDVLEKKLINELKHEIVIKPPKDFYYVRALDSYIDESYQLSVFSKGQLLKVRGLLKLYNEDIVIIKIKHYDDFDHDAMYCLLPEGKDIWYKEMKPEIVGEVSEDEE